MTSTPKRKEYPFRKGTLIFIGKAKEIVFFVDDKNKSFYCCGYEGVEQLEFYTWKDPSFLIGDGKVYKNGEKINGN